MSLQEGNKGTYQENWGLVENLRPHLAHSLSLAGDTDISHETLRSSLEGGNDFRFRGGDGGLDPASTRLCDLTTESPQGLDIANVDR
jgi:hypothetical protein